MSRSSYTDDYGDEYPGQLELYRANVARSMRGKRGQARLRELRDALVALPVKELHEDLFAEGTPQQPRVCALGAWATAKTGDPQAAAEMLRFPVDGNDEDTSEDLEKHGWPRLVVLDTIYQNDRDFYVYETYEWPVQRWQHFPIQRARPETPAERYRRVLSWVEEQIQPPTQAQEGQ